MKGKNKPVVPLITRRVVIPGWAITEVSREVIGEVGGGNVITNLGPGVDLIDQPLQFNWYK